MRFFSAPGFFAVLVLGLAYPSASQSASDEPLIEACKKTEMTSKDSCGCTVSKARAVGLKDSEMASLFKDDGHTEPVSQRSYSLFWQVKAQCIADATMARMGISPSSPLPGVPANMRPGMPLTAPTSPPRSLPAQPAAPSIAASPTQTGVAQAKPASISGVQNQIDQLIGHAWEYTEDNGRKHRYDFLAEGNVMLYRATGGDSYQRPFSSISRISAQMRRGRPEILDRSLTSGGTSDFPVREVEGDTFIYMKRYVRTGEDWPFKKVGPAVESVPENVSRSLEDGYWQVPFDIKVDKTNPFFNQNYRLGGIASPANRYVRSSSLMSGFQALILVNNNSDSAICDHSCFFIVNDFDRRSRQVRGRWIDEVGVDFIGVRIEGVDGDLLKPNSVNTVSVRAYDGYGAWKEWRCSNRDQRLSCTPTGQREAPAQALASKGTLSSQLGTVEVELVGEAQCSTELLLPPEKGLPTSLSAMRAHYRTSKASRFGTAADVAGDINGGYRIKLGGKIRVLRFLSGNASSTTYEGDGVTMRLGNGGQTYSDNPAEGFRVIDVQLESNGIRESLSAIDYSAC